MAGQPVGTGMYSAGPQLGASSRSRNGTEVASTKDWHLVGVNAWVIPEPSSHPRVQGVMLFINRAWQGSRVLKGEIMIHKSRLAVVALAVGLLSIVAACTPAPSGPKNLAPNAIFSTSASNGVAPFDVDFDAADSVDPDGTIVAYNWDFGDFSTGSGVAVSHTFTDPGSFTVTLTVTDNKGAKGSSTSVITVAGPPAAPTGLTKVGSGCCNTYGDFSWNAVPGATQYEILMDGKVGCQTDHSATFSGSATSGRVQAIGLCLGSQYDVTIRAQANGLWGDWSSVIRITL